MTLTAKENLLQEVNKDLTKVYQLNAPKLYGSVQNDGATYSNSYKLLLNKGTTNAYTVTSNVVTVRTPGDGETTTLITPDKNNENADGILINDTVVALGTTNHYRLTWDLDQYKEIVLLKRQLHEASSLWTITQRKCLMWWKMARVLQTLMVRRYQE